MLTPVTTNKLYLRRHSVYPNVFLCEFSHEIRFVDMSSNCICYLYLRYFIHRIYLDSDVTN